MQGMRVAAQVLLAIGILALAGLETSTGAQPGPGHFILVTGSESSGTTMMTRALANLSTSLGIPTNWNTKELSAAARSRHNIPGLGRITKKFNDAMSKLWAGPLPYTYARQHRDTRDTAMVNMQLDRAASQIRALQSAWQQQQQRPLEMVVYHRSMPFGACKVNCSHTPYLADLPRLASRVGWQSRAVMVLRHPATMWASHIKESKLHFEPYFVEIEALLLRCCAVPGAPCSRADDCPLFLRYERILADPAEELGCLLGSAIIHDGGRLKQLLASPELSVDPHRHQGHPGHDAEVERNMVTWHEEFEGRGRFPTFVRVTAQRECL